jgi:hypothetical protein
MSSHWTSETDSLEVEVSYFHIGIIPMCPYLNFLNEIVFFLHSKHIMPLPSLPKSRYSFVFYWWDDIALIELILDFAKKKMRFYFMRRPKLPIY